MGVLSEPVCAVIFEGGRPRTEVEEQLATVRKAVVLDTIEKMGRVPEIDRVILCTNLPDLARDAAALGAAVDYKRRRFHFGRRLLDVVEAYGITNLIYMGGPAAPLLGEEDLSFLGAQLKQRKNVVVQNNVQSPDVVAFTPAHALKAIPLPESDNVLGFALRDLGLERILLPNSARVNFDIDTPTDVMLLQVLGKGGPRTRQAIAALDWDSGRVRAAWRVLGTEGAEIVVAGRVGPPVLSYINMNIPVRLRVFSEERGMKALGRQERGEVVSLLGFLLERTGPGEFFQLLGRCGQALFLDSRVLFAHWRRGISDHDRFQSDLGRWELIGDAELAALTKAAVEAPLPVVMGGHCLVSGGLWLLAEELVEKGLVQK